MKYFKTDGIRGKVNEEITNDLAFKLGVSLDSFEIPIVIGIDTRESSPSLAKAIISGIKNTKYIFAGVISTPALMYYSLKKQCFGVMVTASHNEYYDNGIKVFLNGMKISNDLTELIENKMDRVNEKYCIFEGTLVEDKTALGLYYQFIDDIFEKPSFKVIFDCANGATSEIVRHYFADSEIINFLPNGKNINLNSGSTHPQGLLNKVRAEKAKIGFAFDGDGDRIIVANSNGEIYEGDMLLYFYALALKKNQELFLDTIVTTEIINPGIVYAFNEKKINIITTDIGDRNIALALNSGYSLGGETSGHIINKKYLPFGDGFLNSLIMIKLLNNYNQKIETIFKNISLHHKAEIKVANEKYTEKANRKIELVKKRYDAKIIVRKSGTEPVVRIIIYHRSRIIFEHLVRKIRKILK